MEKKNPRMFSSEGFIFNLSGLFTELCHIKLVIFSLQSHQIVMRTMFADTVGGGGQRYGRHDGSLPGRWATIRVVRLRDSCISDSWIRFSVSLSREEVASL